MQLFSIVSVAFDGYERYIEEFVRKHSVFSDDIIIDTTHDVSMGGMRQRAMSKAKHPYIINLDIDDELLETPDVFSADFIGLGWVEGDISKSYWRPDEKRSETNTIRSNFMISKATHDAVPLPDQDFYIYEYIRRLCLSEATFTKTNNFCVRYNRRIDSVSSDSTTEQHEQARRDLRRLDKAVR